MRFNPPPNWPEVPDGWSPPPGWQPDPSWPQPPWGWPLWVDDDEPTVSMSPSTAAQWQMRQRTRQVPAPTVPWYRRTFAVVLFLVVFFPVGVALLWMRTDWSVRRRGVVTGFVAVLVVIVAATNNPQPTTTTQLSPTTSLGTAGSSSGAGAGANAAASASTGSATMDTPSSAVPGAGRPAETSAAAAASPPAPAPAPSTYVAPPPPPPPSTHAAPPPPPQPPSLCGAPSNPYGYNFCGVGGFVTSPPSDICNYFRCIANFGNGRGYMVECNDGTYSMSGGIRGACSYHQGEDQPVYSG